MFALVNGINLHTVLYETTLGIEQHKNTRIIIRV